MFPLVINTIPENGSDNVALNSIIRIQFESAVTNVNNNTVKLINYNTDEEISGALVESIDSGEIIQITPPEDLEGLTEYRVKINGLETSYGETMIGTYELRFSTMEGAIEDIVENPEEYSFFQVINTYPKEDAVITPEVIKIKFSSDIDLSTDLTKVMLLNENTISNIEDALFIGNNLITIDDININGDMLEIISPNLENGKEYSIVVYGVSDLTGNTVIPFMYSFSVPHNSYYSSIGDILDNKAVSVIAESLSQREIAKKIYDNSVMAEFISKEYNSNIDWEDVPLYVQRYVQTKTQYDILFEKFIELSSNPTSKQLDKLSIEYGFSLNGILKVVDRLKLQYLKWEDYIKGKVKKGNAMPGVFIKGNKVDERPSFMDRAMRDREGNKQW